jgi:signal transduction histidine kinase
MNKQLQTLMDFIQQNENISAEEKLMLVKEIKKVSSDLEIAEFKLDRTEKVKRTTAILLEETIEELEQKRKAVELQNRDLEIESSLERVRTVAMGMRKPDDMLEVCRIISQQSESLGIKEIRNVQTAIIYEDKGTYINYEYYAKHDKLLVTEVDFKNHELQSLFANRMLQGAEELFASSLTGKEVTDWYEYQKTTNQFADSYLENAQSLNYYFYSLGPVALGISTYAPLSEEEISLFKRFRNVFDLAYRRFLDIEQAESQAREARIEASLERVRAQALSMRKPDDLPGICEVLFTELNTLGFTEIRNAMINIHDDEKASFVNYDYSDEIGQSINHLQYNIHPLIEKQIKQVRSAADAFSVTSFAKEDLKDWIAFRKKIGEKDDPRIENTDALYYYFYSIGTGSIGISTFSSIAGDKLNVLKRFRNVFDFAYRRYTDVAQSEAQAREAQIELGLERVRARAMAMRTSEELAQLVDTVFKELTKLHFLLDRCIIMIYDPKTNGSTWWMANPEPGSVPVGVFIKYHEYKPYMEYIKAWQARTLRWEYLLEGNSKKEWDNYIFSETELSLLPDFVIAGMKSVKRVFLNASFNNFGSITASTVEHLPEEQFDILLRFAKVFDMTYTRFNDLKQAEAQAREAQIEAALERIRSRALAMHESSEVGDVSDLLFSELEKMDINPTGFSIMVFDREQDKYELWRAKEVAHQGVYETFSIRAMYDKLDQYIPGFTEELESKWNSGAPFFIAAFSGRKRIAFLEANRDMGSYTEDQFENVLRIYPDPVFWQLIFFKHGWLGLIQNKQLPDDDLQVIHRFADVFEFAHTRFLDLQKAEAHALRAEEDLIAIKVARQKAEEALAELKSTQSLLIQSEKMASLGELTAGIAHEIQNPLNFVNNFSEVSIELLDEMNEELDKGDIEEAKAIASDIKQNLGKINHHGKRADAIVKGMLQHSRSSNGVKEPTDINALADEYLRLAYHGLRAKDKSFNATLKIDFDETLGKIDIIPQDIGRVILNLITNAFYAVDEKKKQQPEGYEPTVSVSTNHSLSSGEGRDEVLISVKDNGNGIPQKVLDKIFQPFFTTKPTGQGTGLGLSLAYDIVKAHGGELKVETKEGEGSEFRIILQIQII